MHKRIVEFDCIRAVSALIIVAFHFSTEILSHTEQDWAPFCLCYDFSNGSWGGVAVTLFFLLSGALLYYQHPDLTALNVVRFYFRRFLVLLPPFWLVWGYLYLQNVLVNRNWFYAASPAKFLLSIVGLDGYFLYRGPNFYLVGEWFLGAILLCYLLYPLLLTLVRKSEKIGTLMLLVGLIAANRWEGFLVSPRRNLFTCLFLVWIGMLLMKYRYIFRKNTVVTAIALGVVLVLLLVPSPRQSLAVEFIFSLAGFVFLWNTSGCVMRIPYVGKFLTFTSRISYPIFLIHHVIIYDQVGKCMGGSLNTKQEFALFIFCLIQIYLFSYLLDYFSKAMQDLCLNILKRKPYQ